jgi:AraC-like DNA-binding protein
MMMPLATEWVLSNGLRASDLPPPTQLAAFPPEIGMADVGFHPLRQGAFLLDVRSHFHVPVTVEARVLVDEPILAIRLPSSGRARLRNGRKTLEESHECWTLSMTVDSLCHIDNHPGETYGALVSIMTAGDLRALVGEHRAIAPLRRFLDGRCEEFDAAVRTSAALRHLADRLRRNPYQGSIAELYREGLLHQLMATALDDLGGETETAQRTLSRDQRRAMAARDILMANLASPPSIADLARQVGTSQRRLSAAFATVFGASPFECLVRWRLDQAHSMLVSGEWSVKQVALLMGYAHVSSFIHAYGRRFGRSPGQDRESST